MKARLTIVRVLLLGLAACAWASASAQDGSAPLEPIAMRMDQSIASEPEQFDDGSKKDCPVSCGPCPSTYGYAELLFLKRSNCSFDQPVLVLRDGPGTLGTALSTSDLDFGFDPALRVLLGHRLHGGWAIEGQYLGLCDANALQVTAGPTGDGQAITFPDPFGSATNVFSDADRVWTDYSSSIHSGELNLVCCNGCCDSCGKGKGDCDSCNLHCRTQEWFVGFRYLNLRERLRINGERDQTTSNPNGSTAVETGVYDIGTSNNLYGPQVGARLRRWGRKLGWEATGKAGIFASDTQQEQYVIDYPDFTERELISASDNGVAFVGELNLTAIYRLNDVWNLRAGYNLIWIEGVALAPDQLDFSDVIGAGNQLSHNGVLLHGVSCGLEARW